MWQEHRRPAPAEVLQLRRRGGELFSGVASRSLPLEAQKKTVEYRQWPSLVVRIQCLIPALRSRHGLSEVPIRVHGAKLCCVKCKCSNYCHMQLYALCTSPAIVEISHFARSDSIEIHNGIMLFSSRA